LEGKKALVVGAGQQPGETIGNGRAIAVLLAREGADVLCVDRDAARAEETAAEIRTAGGKASSFAADIVDAAQVHAMLAAAEAKLGGLDILINNVGIGLMGGGDGKITALTEAAFATTMDVNVKGMFLTIQAALPLLAASDAPAIVNISSIEAVGGESLLAYELSKATVNRLTVAVATTEAARGIRCNAIMPGLMDTPLAINAVSKAAGVSADQARAMLGTRVPLRGELGTAWDTAKAALFLASDESRYITGVILPVDGGMTARVG
jgi:NAD(P)-dependent dehydrogenase (short-subunit alcohol dehydrogenase family)